MSDPGLPNVTYKFHAFLQCLKNVQKTSIKSFFFFEAIQNDMKKMP